MGKEVILISPKHTQREGEREKEREREREREWRREKEGIHSTHSSPGSYTPTLDDVITSRKMKILSKLTCPVRNISDLV